MGVLEGKVAVITGSTRGQGLAIAQAYAREGAAVMLAGRSEGDLAQAVADLRGAGGKGERTAYRRERSCPGAGAGRSCRADIW